MSALYIDTSCVLKLLWSEPETQRTVQLLQQEREVVVSDLVWLETKVRIQGRHAAGLLGKKGARNLLAVAAELVGSPPFERRPVPADAFVHAAAAVTVDGARSHCRTLDRLHLGAMQSLGVGRLLTNDDAQARAARQAGIVVLVPRP